MTDTITLSRAEAKEILRALRTFDAGAMIKAEQMLLAALAQQVDCTITGVCVKNGLYCPAAQQAEQGWVRVPVEPTPEMINAGRTTPMPSDSEFDEDDDYRAVFIAMVAAAPKGGV